MEDLIAFLRARLDDEYEIVRRVLGTNVMADVLAGKPVPRWEVDRSDGTIRSADGIPRVRGTWGQEAAFITHWDPKRILDEIAAKRAILDDFGWEGGETRAVLQLAQVYTEHPDFRSEWLLPAP